MSAHWRLTEERLADTGSCVSPAKPQMGRGKSLLCQPSSASSGAFGGRGKAGRRQRGGGLRGSAAPWDGGGTGRGNNLDPAAK